MAERSHQEFSWLRQSTAEFGIDGCQIEVLSHPQQFYETLKDGIDNAERRVVLASLYLGTGDLEKALVQTLHSKCQQMKESGSQLSVKVLLDFTRGSRGHNNSRTMLLPLVKDFEDTTCVSLYHTPDLRGMLKRLIPERYNETIGVSHLKVYLFDDSVIMSGANLSNDYFTNRQDRYILIKDCPDLANYLDRLVTTVSEFSMRLQSNDTVSTPQELLSHPFEDEDDGSMFKDEAGSRVKSLLSENIHTHIEATSHGIENTQDKTVDTWIYPLVQMGPLGVTQDEEVTKQLFINAETGSKILLASGYFNLTDEYQKVILNSSKADYNILMASPEAMGFFGARGAAGAVPQAYTHVARQFYDKVLDTNSSKRIALSEYMRDKWTFHVKGLWYYMPGSCLPSLTFIGSPNLGYRSVQRDLEAQVAIVTENKSLQQQLHQEQGRINEYATDISCKTFSDRHVRLWVRLVSRFFRSFF